MPANSMENERPGLRAGTPIFGISFLEPDRSFAQSSNAAQDHAYMMRTNCAWNGYAAAPVLQLRAGRSFATAIDVPASPVAAGDPRRNFRQCRRLRKQLRARRIIRNRRTVN